MLVSVYTKLRVTSRKRKNDLLLRRIYDREFLLRVLVHFISDKLLDAFPVSFCFESWFWLWPFQLLECWFMAGGLRGVGSTTDWESGGGAVGCGEGGALVQNLFQIREAATSYWYHVL
eukprot:scaffold53170_cov41-Attheya_sp.AAC.1